MKLIKNREAKTDAETLNKFNLTMLSNILAVYNFLRKNDRGLTQKEVSDIKTMLTFGMAGVLGDNRERELPHGKG